ncbi:MAG: hypothetical protein IT320_12095 [Anaerolineae bacterium]|nr:hypothetical protein [Anaerolineae bacterium]
MIKFGAAEALEGDELRFNRIIIAQRFPGWTLEYIDNLSYKDYQDVLGVMDAQSRIQEEARKARKGRR